MIVFLAEIIAGMNMRYSVAKLIQKFKISPITCAADMSVSGIKGKFEGREFLENLYEILRLHQRVGTGKHILDTKL